MTDSLIFKCVSVGDFGTSISVIENTNQNKMENKLYDRTYDFYPDPQDGKAYIGSNRPGTYSAGDVVYEDGSSDTYEAWAQENSGNMLFLLLQSLFNESMHMLFAQSLL